MNMNYYQCKPHGSKIQKSTSDSYLKSKMVLNVNSTMTTTNKSKDFEWVIGHI